MPKPWARWRKSAFSGRAMFTAERLTHAHQRHGDAPWRVGEESFELAVAAGLVERLAREGRGQLAATKTLGGRGGLDWQAAASLLEPSRSRQRRPAPQRAPGGGISPLADWVAAQREGNRNAGLFWAANRALETNPGADLSPLAAAARQAGLADPEINRTLDSARRTTRHAAQWPDHHPEGAS